MRCAIKLSIVTTLYKSAGHLREFYQRVSNSAHAVTEDYEIVFVNDGSPDDSLDLAREFLASDNRVVVIDLSRNFGHHKAIMAGLAHASGELIFLIDCDLEEDPENLPDFHDALVSDPNCDVVYGSQQRRKGKWFSALRAALFYKVMNAISDVKFYEDMVFSRLMTRRYVQSLLLFKENEFFIVGVWALTGFEQKSLPIATRHRGETSYTFSKLMAMALEAVVSFSVKPLECIFWAGLVIFLTSLLSIGAHLLSYLLLDKVLTGWTSLMLSIWFLGGLNILFMGIIGIYLSKTLLEAKRRPFYVVKDCFRSSKDRDN